MTTKIIELIWPCKLSEITSLPATGKYLHGTISIQLRFTSTRQVRQRDSRCEENVLQYQAPCMCSWKARLRKGERHPPSNVRLQFRGNPLTECSLRTNFIHVNQAITVHLRCQGTPQNHSNAYQDSWNLKKKTLTLPRLPQKACTEQASLQVPSSKKNINRVSTGHCSSTKYLSKVHGSKRCHGEKLQRLPNDFSPGSHDRQVVQVRSAEC